MNKCIVFIFLWALVLGACTPKKSGNTVSQVQSGENAPFREVSELPIQPTLPNLMVNRHGDTIQSLSEWEKHRNYLKAMLRFYQYGEIPPKPSDVTVVETRTKIENERVQSDYDFTISRNGQTLTFGVSIIRPNDEGPYPVIIKNDRYRFDLDGIWNKRIREKYSKQNRTAIDSFVARESLRRKYIYCKFNREDIVRDSKEATDGGLFALYPEYDFGAITAWAWTYQRIIDWLYQQPFVDREKIVATGHSRGGKTALCAGIYDERIAITAPNSSGLGGTASLRFYDFSRSTEVQTIQHHTTRFPYWWPNRWHTLQNHLDRVPFDTHFHKALIAPRALFNSHARQDYWANPFGTYLTYRYAQDVFDLYDVGHHNAIHWRDGGHAQNREDWSALLDYCDWIFYQKTPQRQFDAYPYPGTSWDRSLESYDITKL